MDKESCQCTCGEPASGQCLDCQEPLCNEHTCGNCGRCETDCICSLLWWTPDLFI
jgi:hypothetical protein